MIRGICGRSRLAIALVVGLALWIWPSTGQAWVYTVVPCGGAFDPCSIVGSYRAPTPDQLAGFNNQLFLDYYKPLLQGQTGTFGLTIKDSNSNGYIIGGVNGPNQIHTQFIFYQGQLLCCFADEPFTLTDINESNDVVGWDIYTTGPTLIHPGVGRELLTAFPDGKQISFYWHPEAIDDSGNILVRCGYPECQDGNVYYELRVSEPGTLALLLPMIAGLALWPVRRRMLEVWVRSGR